MSNGQKENGIKNGKNKVLKVEIDRVASTLTVEMCAEAMECVRSFKRMGTRFNEDGGLQKAMKTTGFNTVRRKQKTK